MLCSPVRPAHLESIKGLEAEVKLPWPLDFGEVGEHELSWLLQGCLQVQGPQPPWLTLHAVGAGQAGWLELQWVW